MSDKTDSTVSFAFSGKIRRAICNARLSWGPKYPTHKLTHSSPNLKMSIGTTFILNTTLIFRKQSKNKMNQNLFL